MKEITSQNKKYPVVIDHVFVISDTGLSLFSATFNPDEKFDIIEKSPELFSGFLGALFLFSTELGRPIEEIVLENMKIVAKRVGNAILVFVVNSNREIADLHHRIFVAGELFRAKYEQKVRSSTFSGNVSQFKEFKKDLEKIGIPFNTDKYKAHCPYCGMGAECPYSSSLEEATKKDLEQRELFAKSVKFAKAPFYKIMKETTGLRIKKSSVKTVIDLVLDYTEEIVCPRLREMALIDEFEDDKVRPVLIRRLAASLDINMNQDSEKIFPLSAVKRLLNYGRVLYSKDTPKVFEQFLVALVKHISIKAAQQAKINGRKTIHPIDVEKVRDQLFVTARLQTIDIPVISSA